MAWISNVPFSLSMFWRQVHVRVMCGRGGDIATLSVLWFWRGVGKAQTEYRSSQRPRRLCGCTACV